MFVVLIQIFHYLSISKVDDDWHIIKEDKGIVYKWRLMNDRYQLIAGEYSDVETAKKDAEKLYVNAFYNYCDLVDRTSHCGSMGMMFTDKYTDFIQEPDHYDFTSPIAIYQVDDMSKIENYRYLTGSVSMVIDYNKYFCFDNLFSDDCFKYNSESHHYLYVLNLANNISEFGFEMTLLCGLLERISQDFNKNGSVINEIDRLINMIDKSNITDNEYNQLRNYLCNGKKASIRQKCIMTIERYASDFICYDVSAKDIFNSAYNARCAYAHGSDVEYNSSACYMKYLMRYIIKEYFKEKQRGN